MIVSIEIMDLYSRSSKLFFNILKIILIIVIIVMQFILIFNSVNINIELNSNEKQPIDYQIKDIDECYLTVHNFVSMKSRQKNKSKNNIEFKTYIYSYTKPYLLELVQNSTHDCLCSN